MTTITKSTAFLDKSQPLETRTADLLSRLTLEEKVALMAGAASFTLEGVERLGVPRIRVTDGPTGVRSNEGEPATVFPVGVAMASTWNPELAREVAAAIGREALALDNRVVLAPTINIVRTPLWGRNFETYSEDPFLAGRLGAAFVEGLQGEGVGASLKHYAANNQEENRMTVSVEADERTLREIYLAAFEYVVKTANPWTVMASYNKLEGVYATESKKLMLDILKGEWGYDGVVVSDWGAVHSTAAAANGGTDLEMPGPPRWFGEKLMAAVKAGEVFERQIDDAARRMCRLILRTGVLDGDPPPKGELRTERHRKIAERAAVESVVLLKNEHDLLPLLPSSVKTLAVVGPNAAARRIQGGGSSQVRTDRRTSLLAAIAARLAGRVEVLHADGGDNEVAPPSARSAQFSPDEGRGQAGVLCEYFADAAFTGPPIASRPERGLGKLVSHNMGSSQPPSYDAFRWSGWYWPEKDGRYEFSLRGPGAMRMWLDGEPLIDDATAGAPDRGDVGGGAAIRKTVGLDLAAGRGYPVRIDYVRAMASRADQIASGDASPELNWEYVSLGVREPRGSVAEAAELAGRCDAAVVVVGAGSLTEGEGYDRENLDLPGDQNALVEAVLAANPRTVVVLSNGAPYALPWIDHAPAVVEGWLGGEAGPDAVARILIGEAEPSGRLPVTFPVRIEDSPAHRFYPGGAAVRYGEGLRVGYRHFDAGIEPPLFPFGFGLTYTKFRYSDLDAPETVRIGQGVRVRFALENVGERNGKETAQLYVRPRGPSVDRPVKELKGFAKVELAPMQRRTVEIDLDERAFSYYDPAARKWLVEPGAYDLLIGGSAADIELQATVRLEPRG
ncbi:MAG TPA: glycoside hydrolase family 3 C-terminal domain-containing protein [Caulobacteraceae bacterium]|nr:glycoside hydrolase family 3 C-terminal domain-containing protein [Caulobacteraceae bacterium]